MTNKFQLRGLALIIGGLVLSGCGNKQLLNTELEDARKAFAHASTDPQITLLAAAELDKAEKQLRIAEKASAYFKPAERITHEATIAKLKTLEAQQTARALTAKENLRVAQLSQPLSHPVTGESPILAAAKSASPAPAPLSPAPLPVQPDTGSDTGSATISGQASGGHNEQTEVQATNNPKQLSQQELAQQLKALTQQLQELQQNLQQNDSVHEVTNHDLSGQDLTSQDLTSHDNTISDSTIPDNSIQEGALENRIVYLEETSVTSLPLSAEPQLGAAIAAPENNTLADTTLENTALDKAALVNIALGKTASENPAPVITAPATSEVVADARLREELRAMNARPSDQGMSLTLGERYFENGSARLWSGRAARHLDNVAAVMSENLELRLDVEAHTDPSAGKEQGHNLTSDRAIAIKSALVLRGVDAARINTTGFGDTAPIADNDTPLGRLQNRRVELIFPNITL